MPKTKLEDVVFTLFMVFVMVYAMIYYNIALKTGGMHRDIFLAAFHELILMAPIAFVLDFFLVGKIAKKTAFRLVDPEKENPFHLVLAISAVSVLWMCPLMSLAATLLFQNTDAGLLPVWMQTVALNFPMAFFWQLCYAGPFVRAVFRLIFRRRAAGRDSSECI